MLRIFYRPCACRRFSNSRVWQNAELEKKVAKPAETPESFGTQGVEISFSPTEYEKTLLVLSGKYKSKAEIPPRVSYETMQHARSRVRIRGSNILMAGTLVLCGFYVWLGKKKAREGQSINKMVLEQDQKIIEAAKKRREA